MCILPVTLVQWFPTGDDFAPRRYWAVSRDIVSGHDWVERGLLPAPSRGGQGGHSTYKHTGDPTSETEPAPHVSGADTETPVQPVVSVSLSLNVHN